MNEVLESLYSIVKNAHIPELDDLSFFSFLKNL